MKSIQQDIHKCHTHDRKVPSVRIMFTARVLSGRFPEACSRLASAGSPMSGSHQFTATIPGYFRVYKLTTQNDQVWSRWLGENQALASAVLALANLELASGVATYPQWWPETESPHRDWNILIHCSTCIWNEIKTKMI